MKLKILIERTINTSIGPNIINIYERKFIAKKYISEDYPVICSC
jgi:hypothetical protein